MSTHLLADRAEFLRLEDAVHEQRLKVAHDRIRNAVLGCSIDEEFDGVLVVEQHRRIRVLARRPASLEQFARVEEALLVAFEAGRVPGQVDEERFEHSPGIRAGRQLSRQTTPFVQFRGDPRRQQRGDVGLVAIEEVTSVSDRCARADRAVDRGLQRARLLGPVNRRGRRGLRRDLGGLRRHAVRSRRPGLSCTMRPAFISRARIWVMVERGRPKAATMSGVVQPGWPATKSTIAWRVETLHVAQSHY